MTDATDVAALARRLDALEARNDELVAENRDLRARLDDRPARSGGSDDALRATATAPGAPVGRRNLLRGGLAAGAAAAGAVLLDASPAAAGDGAALILGSNSSNYADSITTVGFSPSARLILNGQGSGALYAWANTTESSTSAVTATAQFFSVASGAAVQGIADGAGSAAGIGILGKSRHRVGVKGVTDNGVGVEGESLTATGVLGVGRVGVTGIGRSDGEAGVTGTHSSQSGVVGTSVTGFGVRGEAPSGTGVVGTGPVGVSGNSSNSAGAGVAGTNTNGRGVSGQSSSAAGVYGRSGTNFGVHGESPSGTGVYGQGPTGISGLGTAANGSGVVGGSPSGTGVTGQSTSGVGVKATSLSGTALQLVGRVPVDIVPQAGPPTSGAHTAGQLWMEGTTSAGTLWLCVSSGTPGLWRKLGGLETNGALHVLPAPAPARVYDSRAGAAPTAVGPKTRFAANETRAFDLKVNSSTVPAGASAALVTLLLVNASTSPGNLTIWANGVTKPLANTMVWGGTAARFTATATTALDTLARVQVNASQPTDLVIDVVGYYR